MEIIQYKYRMRYGEKLNFPDDLVILRRQKIEGRSPYREISVAEIPEDKLDTIIDAISFLEGQRAIGNEGAFVTLNLKSGQGDSMTGGVVIRGSENHRSAVITSAL